MTTEPGFEDAWRADLQKGVTGVQLVEIQHPLEVYVGASDAGLARVQLRTFVKPTLPVLADVVLVDRDLMGQTWVLTLTLQDSRFREVFIRLASHLVTRSRTAQSEDDGLKIVDQVIDEWRRLMTPRPTSRLSLEALRGLVGELWFLLNRHALGEERFEVAVEGWLGPLGEPQDFWSSGSGLREVKSVGPSASVVKISSAEQLDPGSLELTVLELPQVSEGTVGAVTLSKLMTEAVDRLSTEDCQPDALELRFKRLGVDMSDEWYAEQWFRVDSVATFEVANGFPRVRARDLPAGVGRVRYQIARASLEPFKRTFEVLS
jgi:hypothetical protein